MVEPSEELIDKYKSYVSSASGSTPNDLKGVDFHWYPQLLQTFKGRRDEEADQTKFHFISALHSLYYFDNLGKWLDYLYSLLDEGGLLIIFLTSGKNFGTMNYDVDVKKPEMVFIGQCGRYLQAK